MGTSSLSSRGEDGQSDQRDGGGDGEGADVLQQQPRQPAEADRHLDGAGDDDGALDLNHGGKRDTDVSFTSAAASAHRQPPPL